MARPSATALRRLFLEAKASARPMMAQLVTMSGMKMPRIRYSSCRKAFISSSMAVTKAAMTITKIGMRTSSRTLSRMAATAALLAVSTSRVARPRPRALTTVLLTASSGHRPSNCTKPGLLVQRPFLAMSV